MNKFLLFSGSGMTAGGLCLIFNNKENKTGLITRPKNYQFWLTDEGALGYLAQRVKEKSKNIEKEEEQSNLAEYIKNIVAKKNAEYWQNESQSEEQVKEAQVDDFLSSCDIEQCKTYKVRIFNEYILFDNLVEFIKNLNREELLYFLRFKSTIRHNLQGELINQEVWKTVEAEKLAAFLAFGYYADTCAKFLYLEPDRLITFFENAVYYMYLTEMGNFRSEEDHYYQCVTKVFKKCCRLKIINVNFKEKKGERVPLTHPTEITVEKISKEEESLKE